MRTKYMKVKNQEDKKQEDIYVDWKKFASNSTVLSNPPIKDKKRITHQSSRTAIVEYDLSVAKIWSYRFIPEAF